MKPTSEFSVVTASRLLEGDTVYLAAAGLWTPFLEGAHVFQDADKAAEALARAEAEAHLFVGAYLMPVGIEAGVPTPLHFRETFRATGPTNYDHGKAKIQDAA